jgi:osmotically inducible lipoprotein OsmB
MSPQGKDTAISAGVAAGGSTSGTIGGAVVVGVVGHEINKSK